MHPEHLLPREKMGEMEEERDNVGKLFENFIQASTCKGTLQTFSLLCGQLDLDPVDSSTFYSSLKAKVTTWKAKALWSKLDKRMSHKEYKKGQACAGTKVTGYKSPVKSVFCVIFSQLPIGFISSFVQNSKIPFVL